MKNSLFEKYKTSEVTNTRRVICTPGQFTRDHFFYIQEAGYLKSLQPHLSKRSGLKSYLFMIVLSGSGTVSYKDASPEKASAVSAMAGDCFFLDCSKEYTHISSENDSWELLWIHFYGPQAEGYYSYFCEHNDWHFRSQHLNELTACITRILEMHEHRNDDTDIVVANEITHILTLISTSPKEPERNDSELEIKLKHITIFLQNNFTSANII